MQDTDEPKEHWRDNPAFVEWVESLGKPIPDRLDPMATAMVGAMWLAWNAGPTRTEANLRAKRIAEALHRLVEAYPGTDEWLNALQDARTLLIAEGLTAEPDEWAPTDEHPFGKLPKRATLRSLDERLTRVEKALICPHCEADLSGGEKHDDSCGFDLMKPEAQARALANSPGNLPEGWEWYEPQTPHESKDGDEVRVLAAASKEGYTVDVWNDGEDFLSADGASFEAVEAVIAQRRRDLEERDASQSL